MFEDSLVESTGKFRTNRGKTTTLAFVIQGTILGIMILIPLIYTEALPTKQLMTMLVAPPPPPPLPPPPPAEVHVMKHVSEIVEGQLRTPTKIPNKIVKIVEDEQPAPNTGVTGGVVGGVAGGSAGGVLGGVLSAANTPPPKIAAPQKVRVSSGVAAGNLINHPNPQYPAIARQARISGTVVLAATISKNGTIENLHVLSGHPMLTQAALDAVRQWRYKPYMLNGEPTEVETTVTVNFNLGG